MPRLRRSSCAAPGIARARRGRGFEYRDPDGDRIEDPEVLERIAQLAVPPAWQDVWICIDALGHLQATGIDAAGRKQYLYHPRWRAHRDRAKFDAMLEFASALPRLRRRVARDLEGSRGLTRARVLACAVRLLDVGFFRIGSDDYAERNESYGLTTLLREHVTLRGREMVFDFPAKSRQRRVQAISDAGARPVVQALMRRRGGGSQLLAYRDARQWVEVGAEEVNEYVKRHAGEDFTAKHFRTWNASVLAAVALAACERDGRSIARERAMGSAISSGSSKRGGESSGSGTRGMSKERARPRTGPDMRTEAGALFPRRRLAALPAGGGLLGFAAALARGAPAPCERVRTYLRRR